MAHGLPCLHVGGSSEGPCPTDEPAPSPPRLLFPPIFGHPNGPAHERARALPFPLRRPRTSRSLGRLEQHRIRIEADLDTRREFARASHLHAAANLLRERGRCP